MTQSWRANTVGKANSSHATASEPPVVVEEKHAETTTDWRVWWHWVISAGGLPVLLVQVVLLGLDRASYAALDFWIAKWTLAAEHNNTVVVYGHTLPHAVPGNAGTYTSTWELSP